MFLKSLTLENVENHSEKKAETVKSDCKKDERYLTMNNIKKVTREMIWLLDIKSQWKIKRKIHISMNAEVLSNNILYLKFVQNRQLVITLSAIVRISDTIKHKQNKQE